MPTVTNPTCFCLPADLPTLHHHHTPTVTLQGEDWEHEDVAADDDLDMGEEEEDGAISPVRK